MAFTYIDYDESSNNPLETYQGVRVKYDGEKKKKFNSGDFIKDWYYANKFKIKELLETELYFTDSSSVSDFLFDTRIKEKDQEDSFEMRFDECFLRVIDGKPTLCYSPELCIEGAMFYYVEKDTKLTWEELKERCGDFDNKK